MVAPEQAVPMTPWYVYVIYSLTTGRLYTGVSTAPQRRVGEHNRGKGAKSTRYGRPWEIVRVEPCGSKSVALKREVQIKCLTRAEKLVLVGLAA